MYIYIYMYIYMYVYIYIYVYTCIYVYVYMYIPFSIPSCRHYKTWQSRQQPLFWGQFFWRGAVAEVNWATSITGLAPSSTSIGSW